MFLFVVKARLALVQAATAEVTCHYKMAVEKLKKLVVSAFPADAPSLDHLRHFLDRAAQEQAAGGFVAPHAGDHDKKVMALYQVRFQTDANPSKRSKI
jgi:hypothetical protein